MLPLVLLATLAVATPAPITVNFTSDSVYKYDSILNPVDVQEQENGLYTIILEEEKLLGYRIYDNSETPYIDGLKFDDKFVTNYIINDVDLNIEHSFLIKTVYTEDVAGMLAAAKDGDWSRLLSNPLILLQIFYYILAAISIIIGGFGLVKSKKKKVKTADEIANRVSDKSEVAKDALIETVCALIAPLFKRLDNQNTDIIKALVLSKSQDNNDTIALLDLLKQTQSGEDITELVESIKKEANEAYAKKLVAQANAKKVINAIANGSFAEKEILENDGTSI